MELSEKSFSPTEEKEDNNHLKSEHLNEGVRAIMTCVGTREQFFENPGPEEDFYRDTHSKKRKIQNVDYYGKVKNLSKRGFKNAGKQTYIISPVDNFNKLSMGFRNCNGLVAVGNDKNTGENISFLSHENPEFLDRNRNKIKNLFTSDLRERLKELKEKSIKGTVDVVIIGGNYFADNQYYRDHYLESIRLLSGEVQRIFGFEPVVVTGPKLTGGSDDVFYDNKNRRLYIMRPEVDSASAQSFVPSDIENHEKNWRESKFPVDDGY